MENKYNVGEPVCVYGWVDAIRLSEGKVVYNVVLKDDEGEVIDMVICVPEDIVTTVF